MVQIVLIRPGSTDYDEQGRIQGTLDIPLSEQGTREVERVIEEIRQLGSGNALKGFKFILLGSDLVYAARNAAIKGIQGPRPPKKGKSIGLSRCNGLIGRKNAPPNANATAPITTAASLTTTVKLKRRAKI